MRVACIALLLSACALVSCDKNSTNSSGVPWTGTWVEDQYGKDTIRFQTIDGDPFLTLTTGELNQFGTPKYPTGLYRVQLKKDSILPVWMASSSIHTKYFHFNGNARSFLVGNFYKLDSPLPLLRFNRVN